MGIPVIESVEPATTGGTESTDLVFASAPSGLAAGDLILIIGMCEQQNTDEWQALTGYTAIVLGNNANDAHLRFYWRITTGDANDGFPNLTPTTSYPTFKVGWACRISGVNTSDPINQTGTAEIGSGPDIEVDALTTDAINCLAIFGIAIDGSDVTPVSISGGTGWSMYGNLEDPADNADGVGGAFGTKEVPSIGSTGTVTLTWDADGFQAVQLAIEGAADGGGISMPLVMLQHDHFGGGKING